VTVVVGDAYFMVEPADARRRTWPASSSALAMAARGSRSGERGGLNRVQRTI